METIRTPEKRTAFLAVLAETGIVRRGLEAISISRSAAYKWRDEDADFAAAWDKALAIGIGALEDEAHRRAFEGTPELVLVGDGDAAKPVEVNRKYSDTLAIFLLKAHRPDRYRERSEVTVRKGDPSTMTEAEIRQEIAELQLRLDDAATETPTE